MIRSVMKERMECGLRPATDPLASGALSANRELACRELADASGCCDLWWARRVDGREGLTDLLDDAETRRFHRFGCDADRERFLVGCALAKLVLSRYLGLRPARKVRFVRRCTECGGPHGKPRLQDGELEFSISHSGELIVVAVAKPAVGVDVEEVTGDIPKDLIDMALSEQESAALSHLPSCERLRSFVRSWTQKEAIAKAAGAGMSLDPRAILVDPSDPPRLLEWPHCTAPQDVALFTRVAPKYIVSVAAMGRCETIRSYDGSPLLARRTGEDLV
jgi:4'-phosphopantetheinyl transferase